MGDNWDPQKMLDLYIHDYMLRKNMNTTAEIFAREADIRPKSVLINPPDGFLTEWWSLFWDLYSSRMNKNTQAAQGSTSKDKNNAGASGAQNVGVPMPDMGSYMLQHMSPAMRAPGLPNPLQNMNPTMMPRPDMGSYLLSTMVPRMDFNQNPFGQIPVPDNSMGQQQTIANLMAPPPRMREMEPPKLPNMYSETHLPDVDQLARMLPTSSRLSNPQKANKKRPLATTKDGTGSGARGITISEPVQTPPLPPPSKFTQHNVEPPTDTGKEVNKIPSIQQAQHSAPSPSFQQDVALDLAAQTSGKLVIFAPKSSTKTATPMYADDVSNKRDTQIGKDTQMEKPLADDIDYFFSNDGSPDHMSKSVVRSSPQSSSAQKSIEQEGFPFAQFTSLHPTTNKLLCCDFSTEGKFIAAAGHEKKVFIWNVKQSNFETMMGHSQLITDVCFQPNSNILATSSFDTSVKIWDATKPGRPLFSLIGHREHVTSLDFHPRKSNVLCSCDSNDEIRLWNTYTSVCFHSFKGANRVVRFQPRNGNLLAAATGNIISLIDIETGMIQYRFEGHTKDVRSMCWDIYGQYLVSLSEDSARIWSLGSSGNCVHMLHSGGNKFASCTFHPSYSLVVVVGSYQSVDIWNPAVGSRTWTYRAHNGIVSSLTSSSETNMIGSVSHDQWIKLWK